MSLSTSEWPIPLRERLSGCGFAQNHTGMSGSAVYQVRSGDGETAYLKISSATRLGSLRSERDALIWLQGKFPVPDLLYYEEYRGMHYLLASALSGLDASRREVLARPEQLVRIYAEGLRELHRIPIDTCPLRQTLDVKLAEARIRVEENLVDETDFEPDSKFRTPADVYVHLLDTRPSGEDIVFTHGDYCMPNVIVDNGRLSGFIDLGRAGTADRYQDIALAVRSLRHNFGSDRYKESFLEGYGLQEADESKIDYYTLLDELF
ncbi:APH(3') family aminoglycoside O-phosphotransferase [Cohnella zeiphila]|uniref:Aminoglycoside 3'-phosphotransferase n=1 Tax=Cohnella zeiphila TaxID=2761120 RepID=A0A7X0SLV6_9BACL|nr:APH(3') family aminoglycoside O-phosphotransferase [Cohnella zeiphila]MBB6732387.1 aminoglycoside 3'-phosphotransferase [Cohnella zeiphila]